MQTFKLLSFVSLLCISSAHADIKVDYGDLSETLVPEQLHGTYQNPSTQTSIQISKPNKYGAYPFRFQSPNCQISGHAKYGSDAYTAFYISRAPSGYKQFNTQTGTGEILYCSINFDFQRSAVKLDLDDCLACGQPKQKITLQKTR